MKLNERDLSKFLLKVRTLLGHFYEHEGTENDSEFKYMILRKIPQSAVSERDRCPRDSIQHVIDFFQEIAQKREFIQSTSGKSSQANRPFQRFSPKENRNYFEGENHGSDREHQ